AAGAGAEARAAKGEGEEEAKAEEEKKKEEEPKTPTATQAVVISRPKVPVQPKVPPAPRGKRIGPVKEYQVVTDSLGRGREFVDVTKDKTGKKKTPGGVRRAKEAFSKTELMAMARERAYVPMRGRKRRPTKKGKKTEVTVAAEHKRVIRMEETITVHDLAQRMGVRMAELIRKLFQLGTPATANQGIDVETAELLAADYGFTVQKVGLELEDVIKAAEPVDESKLVPRPPVVTVMGHVDHGKTSLLDYIRKSSVAAGESGGITQHIGAYSVPVGDGSITFLDTPGHEAFTAMRARGAQVTDIAVLVVAADDSVMPQTVESINHAKSADVPIVVAINKCDLPQASPDRVRQGLSEHGLIPEEWGGDTIMVEVSAKTGQGIDKLLEMIQLQGELLELKANPDAPAQGIVIEAKVEKGKGPVATVLVKDGTLRRGDIVLSGTEYGKVRAMTDHTGRQVKEAGPGMPVEVQGLSGVPRAGENFYVAKDERAARELAEKNRDRERQKGLAGDAGVDKKKSLKELLAEMEGGAQKELKIIVKADVQGSVEAVNQALQKLSTDKVKVTLIHSGVGAISESDVMLASASGAMIVGFNTKPDAMAKKTADQEKVDIRTYKVIYDAVNDVKAAMEGLLEPIRREKSLGRAEVKEVFRISGKGAIAGCAVVEGKILRSAMIRVIRGKEPIHEGRLDGLKRFKEDVREVPSGMECGISIAGFNDVQQGDILEAFEVEEIRPSL
ncbi:MAG: translation initiation factor IF-2, partial [Deltaproteobacteria bacterium]